MSSSSAFVDPNCALLYWSIGNNICAAFLLSWPFWPKLEDNMCRHPLCCGRSVGIENLEEISISLGLVVLIGVLQVICVVDDEMAPRMKPNAAGEPSAFSFRYGISFMAAALSFLPVQLCVWLEVALLH